jgi:hypothetical protein
MTGSSGRRRAVVRVATSVVAAIVLAVVAASPATAIEPCSKVYHRAPRVDLGPGPAPLLIADSVVAYGMREIQDQGYRVNAQGCRTFARGVAALAAIADHRPLPDLVVIALGSVGRIKQRQIVRALQIIGPERTLGLMTPRRFHGGEDPDAERIRRAAARSSQIDLIDWAATSAGHPQWFYPDLVHPTPDGADTLATLLGSATLSPPTGLPPSSPPRGRGS